MESLRKKNETKIEQIQNNNTSKNKSKHKSQTIQNKMKYRVPLFLIWTHRMHTLSTACLWRVGRVVWRSHALLEPRLRVSGGEKSVSNELWGVKKRVDQKRGVRNSEECRSEWREEIGRKEWVKKRVEWVKKKRIERWKEMTDGKNDQMKGMIDL